MFHDNKIHVVIASYHGKGEVLDSITHLKSNLYSYFVYVQCDGHCARTKQIMSCESSNNCQLSYLPNVGRESRVYLHHILMTYRNLPPYIYFYQENEFGKLNLGMLPAVQRDVLYPNICLLYTSPSPRDH